VATKIVANRKGVKALLDEPGVRADIYERTTRVWRAAGASEHSLFLDDKRYGDRPRGAVVTATEEAREAEADYRNLTRAVDAARG
jgi:hypothetical protein